jgi:hypothetical protein
LTTIDNEATPKKRDTHAHVRAASSPEARAKAVATFKARRALESAKTRATNKKGKASQIAAAHTPAARAKAGATRRANHAAKKAAKAAVADRMRLIPLDAIAADKPPRGPYAKRNAGVHVESLPRGNSGAMDRLILLKLLQIAEKIVG